MSGDGAIRYSSPHPPEARDKDKCGGCRLQAELDGLRAARDEARLMAIGYAVLLALAVALLVGIERA